MAKKSLWSTGHTLKRFDIIPAGGGEATNLMGQSAGIKYYEDVIDSSVHVEIFCYDTFGFLNELPIRSGMTVHLEVEHPSSEENFIWDDSTDPLVITNISANTSDTKRELFALTLSTKHAVSNHTTRVWEKYTGKISDIVKKIMEDKLDVTERLTVHDTKNESEFTGNYRRPLFMISRLCPKSIPTTSDGDKPSKGSSGYLFFETQDGYNYLSIDKIFDDASPDDAVKYILPSDKSTLDPNNNFYFSSPPRWVESHDLLKKLRSGAYKAANYYYNIQTRQPIFSEYSLTESLRKYLKLSNDEENVPAVYAEFYSRMTFGILDNATMTPNEKGQDAETPQDQANFQAQSSARYAALFSQMLNITVPMNLGLRAGQVIFCEFPKLNIEKPTRTGVNPASGLYMIARLAHEFGDNSYTGLTLVRDSFQPNE
tara:strand:+ start:2008 stop:3291 length:1284 start_codon:yes stop_codon:yes gene_type:complete